LTNLRIYEFSIVDCDDRENRALCKHHGTRELQSPTPRIEILEQFAVAFPIVYWLELITAAYTTADPALPELLAEANELSAIFNQSRLTARMNQAAKRQAKSHNTQPQSHNPQSNSSIRKSVNS
jgi:hypothetical protein